MKFPITIEDIVAAPETEDVYTNQIDLIGLICELGLTVTKTTLPSVAKYVDRMDKQYQIIFYILLVRRDLNFTNTPELTKWIEANTVLFR